MSGSGSQRLAPALRLKRSVGATLGAAALALTCGAHAGGLFLPVGAVGAASRGIEVGPDAGERRVRVARRELGAVRDDIESVGAGRLVLNIADGVGLYVVVERTATTKWGYSLSGRVAGDGVGFVTLVVHEDAVAGSIWTLEAEYELSSLGGDVHALRDVTNAPPFECGGALPSESLAASATTQGGTDDGSVVDILVVWTPEAEEEWGGGAAVRSRIELLIAYTNDAFERSGAFVSLNLVGAEQVDYAEAESGRWSLDVGTNLNRLMSPDDGHMDDVHGRRDASGADLVYLLTALRGGRAERPGSFSTGGGHPTTFAHEVGHNMGLAHDRSAGSIYGDFQNGFTTEHCFRTIMSYGAACHRYGVPRLPFYASPWRYDPVHGVPLGVTRFAKEQGARGPADAVLALNRNRHRAANYRSSRKSE